MRRTALAEPRVVRWSLAIAAFLFLGLVLVLPIAAVFVEAFRKGMDAYVRAVRDPETRAAIELTALTTAIVVPANTIFAIAAAWAIAKFRFPGKQALVTLIDL